MTFIDTHLCQVFQSLNFFFCSWKVEILVNILDYYDSL